MQKLKQKIKDFLIWGQKYTGTDNVYLAKGGFWLTLGQIISTAASFLLAVTFANLIDPITFGNYKYVLSLVGILTIFALPGIGTAIIQAVVRGLECSFYTGFKTKLKWGLLGSLAALILTGYYFIRGNYLLPIPLLISAIFLPLMLASQVYGSFLVGRKLFKFQVTYNTISQVISAGALIITLFLTQNLFWLIAVYFVSHTFLNFFFYLITKRKFQPNKKEDPQTLSYGKHLSLMGALSIGANYLDKILLFTLIGSTQLAIYWFAIALPEQIKGLLKNIQILALPKFAQRTKEEIKSTILKKMGKLFLLLLPIIGIYVLIAPFLYKFIFPQYLDSIFYSQIFALSIVAVIAILPYTALQAQMAKKQLYQLNVYSSLIQIFLLFVFVLTHGLLGVILARTISRFINLGIICILVRKI